MADWINFLLESTFWLGIFYLVNQLILQPVKWPVFNRFFLLCGLVLAIVLPLLHFNFWQKPIEPFVINLGEAVENLSRMPVPAPNPDSPPANEHWSVLVYGYLVVSAFLLLRLLWSLAQVSLYKNKRHRIPENLLAFSYFNFIYLHPKIKEQPDADLILSHEKAHVRQWHSLDILLLQLTKVVCWANPVLWLYHKPMRENHEYLADEEVIRQYPHKVNSYQQQMLNLQLGLLYPGIVNNFNILPHKKRIDMIKKNQITRRGKITLALSMFFFALTLFACKEVVDNIETDQVYQVNELDQLELSTNSRTFYENIQRTLKYPAEARMNEVAGTYYISFTLTREGQVTEVEVNKQKTLPKALSEIVVVGYGKMKNVPKLGLEDMETDLPPTLPKEKLDKANAEKALEQSLVETFQSLSPLNPGIKDGKLVKIRLEVPITFKLG